MTAESMVSSPNTEKARRASALLATVLIVILLLFPAVVGTWFFLNPVLQAGTGPTFVWVEVAGLAELPDDGVAHQFVLRLPFRDAWSRRVVPGTPVYLTRSPGTDRVTALSALDPHCGCEIRYDEPSKSFRDSCHGGLFNATGARLPHSVSPRDLDPLDVQRRGDTIWVKYQEFQPASEQRIALPLDELRY
jgi:Rieske Fe-S protein